MLTVLFSDNFFSLKTSQIAKSQIAKSQIIKIEYLLFIKNNMSSFFNVFQKNKAVIKDDDFEIIEPIVNTTNFYDIEFTNNSNVKITSQDFIKKYFCNITKSKVKVTATFEDGAFITKTVSPKEMVSSHLFGGIYDAISDFKHYTDKIKINMPTQIVLCNENKTYKFEFEDAKEIVKIKNYTKNDNLIFTHCNTNIIVSLSDSAPNDTVIILKRDTPLCKVTFYI